MVAALLLTGTLGASLGMVVALGFSSHLVGGLMAVATGFVWGFVSPLGALLTLPPSTTDLLGDIERRQRAQDYRSDLAKEEYKATEKACSRLKTAALARDRYEEANQQYELYRQVHQSKKNELLSREWRSLRGSAFEDFLVDVFEELGYPVQTTKATGDQGVDLIVVIDRHRLAVQTKGYEKSVGNASVQEVYAGMQFYHCDACAVITNSRFTRAAVALACSTGCQLIDGSDIPQLIRGELVLVVNNN
jgi:HJR/Mrr/RecB family endonuclease